MTFQALNSALSGLRVAQQQLSVISNNVANVGTEGYTRKILPQSTVAINSTGDVIGVRGDAIIRRVDLNLERDLWTQVSAVSALDIKSTYLSQIDRFHGPPNSEVSIGAELANLRDDIASLTDNPNDSFLQRSVISQAEVVTKRFNDFGALITQQRNDTQDEIDRSVDRVNGLLTLIADLNDQIKNATILEKTTANLADLRDQAIKDLSSELDISFFQRGDGVLVVQTSNGVQLADERAETLFFEPGLIGPTSIYPDSAAGIFVGGDPDDNPNSIDVTLSDLGGKIGGLIELRDEILPTYQAQIDELAHKTALRFEAQGLRLFTNESGAVPADTPPDLGTNPPTPVSYIGFASIIEVNELIIADNSLLQRGTYTSDVPVLSGSSEVLNRVLEFTFGDASFQQAVGAVDIRIASSGSADLQEHLGVYSQNQIVLGPDLTRYSEIDSGGLNATDLVTTLSEFAPTYPADDEFRIQLFDRFGAAIPTTVNIDLSTLGSDPLYAIGAADPSGTLGDGTIDNALDQLIAFINTTIIAEEGALNIPTDIQARASVNAFGQFVFESRGDVGFVTSGFANASGDTLFRAIFGTTGQVFETEHPSFQVQVGAGAPVSIEIEPGDDETTLLAKLEKLTSADPGVPGLLVDDIAFAAGTLTLRPGTDDTGFSGPAFGGALSLISGSGQADGSGIAAAGVNLIEALFGSAAPITSVGYASETSQNLGVGSGSFVEFRFNNLGQGANLSTRLDTGNTLIDFAQKLVSDHAQQLSFTNSQQADEQTLQDLLQSRFLNESGVNIDEELSNLILVQTAYSAAARAVSAVDELFRELLDAVR